LLLANATLPVKSIAPIKPAMIFFIYSMILFEINYFKDNIIMNIPEGAIIRE